MSLTAGSVGAVALVQKWQQQSNQSKKETPGELIGREVVSQLVHDVGALRERCEGLEVTNTELKTALLAATRDHSGCSSPLSPIWTATRDAKPDPSSRYASRYASSETAIIAVPEDLTIKDVENFKSDVGLSVDTMSAILQQFKTELAAEKSARCQLAEELERTKADEARAKERMTTMEAKMKKFDEPSCDQTKALAEKAHQNEDRVAALQAQLDSLGLETGKQSASLDQSRKEQPSLSAKDMDDMKKLRREVRIMKHNVNMQQTIDNFWSKDQMYAAYHQIERALYNDDAAPGPFTGTEDQLFLLRNRVLRRLALYDLHSSACEEAKKAEVDI